MKNGTDYRTLVKAYAIRFDVLVNGNVSMYLFKRMYLKQTLNHTCVQSTYTYNTSPNCFKQNVEFRFQMDRKGYLNEQGNSVDFLSTLCTQSRKLKPANVNDPCSFQGREIQHDPYTYQHGGSLHFSGSGECYCYMNTCLD